jgi:hypothetical protein
VLSRIIYGDCSNKKNLIKLVVTTVAMPTLVVTNFNIVCATLGGFITLFGLVSYLFKERFYLSEARMLSSPVAETGLSS